MPVDASVFNNIHNYQDYNMANQDFLARQQAAQLDAATKANILKAQIIGAGAGSGDQDTYTKAVQSLQQMGIDATDVPSDIQSGVGYANAAINAQKPYALGNAQIKAIGANAAGISALGSQADAANAGLSIPVPTGAITPPISAITPMQARSLPPSAVTGSQSFNPPDARITATSPSPVNGMPPEKAAAITAMFGSGEPQPAIQTKPAVPSNVPSQPTKEPTETPANYNARLSAWKEDPRVIASQEGAKTSAVETAKNTTKAVDEANKATNGFEAISKNIDALESLNPKVATGNYFAPEIKGYLDKRLGSGDVNKNLATWNEINQQQVINGLKQLVQSGQIRGNQFVEKIINRGYAVDPDADVATRQQQLTALRNELANSATSAQNNAADYTGAPKKEYRDILPATNKQDSIPNGAIADGPNGAKLVRVDGKWKPM